MGKYTSNEGEYIYPLLDQLEMAPLDQPTDVMNCETLRNKILSLNDLTLLLPALPLLIFIQHFALSTFETYWLFLLENGGHIGGRPMLRLVISKTEPWR